MLTVTEQARMKLWDWEASRKGDDAPILREDGRIYTCEDVIREASGGKAGA